MCKKLFFVLFFICCVFNSVIFAQENMRIFSKENGEVITGFKTSSLPEDVKITIAYPDNYKDASAQRFALVLLFDTEEYKIEDLRQMFYTSNKKNILPVVASFRFKNFNLTQQQMDSFIEDIFAFFQLNYKGESEPSKRIILARDSMALLVLNSLSKESNYFFNLGMILNNTTSLPAFDKNLKQQSRIFCFAPRENILHLQNLLILNGLKPMQNFFFQMINEASFDLFDLRYFLDKTPKIKQIKTNLQKEISQETPFYLQVKTDYGMLNFFPLQMRFAPPILGYDEYSGLLQVLLSEKGKVKISGIFADKKWSKTVKILN